MIYRKAGFRSGFTIVEMLISLAILAVLLTAVAVAFNASAINYSQNEDMFKAMNTARQTLQRITSQIRTAQDVALIGAGSGEDIDNKQCTLHTQDGQDITYIYTPADNTLRLITNDDATDDDYILCSNVTAMIFDRSPVPDSNPVEIKNVQISITVTLDNASQTISTAAVLRKNM